MVLPKVAQRLSAKVEKAYLPRGMYGEAIRTGRKLAHNIGDTVMNMNKNIDVTFDIDALEVIRKQAAIKLELTKYKYIMDNVNKVDVSSDENFQKVFDSFYINGYGASSAWKAAYYAYFQEVKNNPDKQTFETIIRYFQETENLPSYNSKCKKRIEMSFSGKMLATIQPDKPIWDKHIRDFFKMTSPKIIDNAIKEYARLENKYNAFLQTSDANNWIAAFDSAFPAYTWISKTKKIDFIIFWNQKNKKNQ